MRAVGVRSAPADNEAEVPAHGTPVAASVAGTQRPTPRPPLNVIMYEQIRAERARPLLALVLWDVETANDPSLVAIAHTVASIFFDTCSM